MKKTVKIALLIWALVVFGVYAFCLQQGIDVFLALWVILALFGLLFFLADTTLGRTVITGKNKSPRVIEDDIKERIQERRQSILDDTSVISTIIAWGSVPFILCLLHNYLFL